MILALTFCHKDASLALKNSELMAKYGAYHNHTLLLAYNQECKKTGQAEPIKAILAPIFGKVLEDFVPYDSDERKWPIAPNHLFRRLSFHIEQNVCRPWFFMEADATAMRGTFLDEMEAEYRTCGKPFYGEAVTGSNNKIITHMSGNAIYPANATELAPTINAASATAWDVYCAKQIMPQAFYTNKIQHSFWMHFDPLEMPTFPDQASLSFIRPEACVFHRCKDGTLADRLIEKLNNPAGDAGARPAEFVRSRGVKETVETPAITLKTDIKISNGSPQTDIFIKTCKHDEPYHVHCLRSIKKFTSGFRNTVVIEGEHEKGYLMQQVVKLNADQRTDARYILFTDSDTLFYRPVKPSDYMKDGKTIWLYTPFEKAVEKEGKAANKWRDAMIAFIGKPSPHEFMRRHPEMIPRWLLEAFRAYCWQKHGKSVEDYVMANDNFSEWNVLGFYAWTFHREAFKWINTETDPMPIETVRQFWSHDPISKNIDEIERILSGEPVTIQIEEKPDPKREAMLARMAKARAGRGKKNKRRKPAMA